MFPFFLFLNKCTHNIGEHTFCETTAKIVTHVLSFASNAHTMFGVFREYFSLQNIFLLIVELSILSVV